MHHPKGQAVLSDDERWRLARALASSLTPVSYLERPATRSVRARLVIVLLCAILLTLGLFLIR